MAISNPYLRLRPDVTTCETEDGMVLLDERTGAYWQLNATGAHIVRALLGGGTPEGVGHELAATRNVQPEQAIADIRVLLTQLAEAGLGRAAAQ